MPAAKAQRQNSNMEPLNSGQLLEFLEFWNFWELLELPESQRSHHLSAMFLVAQGIITVVSAGPSWQT